jgi:hypothetical protein
MGAAMTRPIELKNPRLAFAAQKFGGVQKLVQFLGIGEATIRRIDKNPLPKIWSLALDSLLDTRPQTITQIAHVSQKPRRLGEPKPPLEELTAREYFFSNQGLEGERLDYFLFTGEEMDLGPAQNERERWTNGQGIEIEAPREEGVRFYRK